MMERKRTKTVWIYKITLLQEMILCIKNVKVRYVCKWDCCNIKTRLKQSHSLYITIFIQSVAVIINSLILIKVSQKLAKNAIANKYYYSNPNIIAFKM